jgi:hypothetical protein
MHRIMVEVLKVPSRAPQRVPFGTSLGTLSK